MKLLQSFCNGKLRNTEHENNILFSLSLPGTAPSKPEDDKDEEKNSGQKSRMDPMSKVDEYFKKREHKLHKKHKKDHKKEHKKSHKKEV